MTNLKVVKLNAESIEFENGIVLQSAHLSDCCEHHYLCFKDLKLNDFDGLEFNLTNENFFERIVGYGIGLIPIKGHSLQIPGYGSNNGYYSENLSLTLTDNNGEIIAEYDIEECQVVSE